MFNLAQHTYTRDVIITDTAGNTGISQKRGFNVDTTPPTVSTGFISAGLTGSSGAQLFYDGTISIRATVSDNIGLSGTSCKYTLTGTTWLTTTYS